MSIKTKEEQAEFWSKFQENLELDNEFPAEYIYKFIIPTSEEKLNTLNAIFIDFESTFTTRQSSTGKFTSISISILHNSSQEIIDLYKKATLIEGIKSL
jgi:uncharacterized protein